MNVYFVVYLVVKSLQKNLEAAKGDRKKLVAIYRSPSKHINESHRVETLSDMSPEEYLKELFETNDVIDGVEIWTSKNVVVADLVVGTLLKQLRDTGIAGREIADLVDLNEHRWPS